MKLQRLVLVVLVCMLGILAGCDALLNALADDEPALDPQSEPQPEPPPVIASTFDHDTEGWTYVGDSGSYIVHHDTGGNPGGFIRHHDAASGTSDFLVAPTAYRGDRSGFYGGTFRYDLRSSNLANPANHSYDVRISGAGTTVYYHHGGPAEAGAWYSFVMVLDDQSGWRVGSPTGADATQAQMETVLSDITSIHIFADYRVGPEQIDLDNVMLIPPGVE